LKGLHHRWGEKFGKPGFFSLLIISFISVLVIIRCVEDFAGNANRENYEITPAGIILEYHKLYTEIESFDKYISPLISARFLMSLNVTINEVVKEFENQDKGPNDFHYNFSNSYRHLENNTALSYWLHHALAQHLQSMFGNRVKNCKQLIDNRFKSVESKILTDKSFAESANPDVQKRAKSISDSVVKHFLPDDYVLFPELMRRDTFYPKSSFPNVTTKDVWVKSLLRFGSILPELNIQNPQLPLKKDFIPPTEKELYAEALEIYTLSKPLSNEYKWIAEFWSDDLPGVTFSPSTRWFSILNQVVESEKSTFDQVKEMYFILSLAIHETAVICWELKYSTLCSRPASYIKAKIDPSWEPFHANPVFPAYPSGHSSFSAAASTILEHYFGAKYSFTDNSHKGNRAFYSDPRSYDSFHEMSQENAKSRMYLGVHFRKDCEDGLHLGSEVGSKILSLLPTEKNTKIIISGISY
jgi:hypothetical protein